MVYSRAMQLCCLACTSVLDKTRIEDIEVDYCRECGGLWLDQGELERIARIAQQNPELVTELRRKLLPLPTARPEPSEITASCPSCARATMREVALGELHVDHCTVCKGVFLDKGELDAALEKVALPGTRLSVLVAAATRELAAA